MKLTVCLRHIDLKVLAPFVESEGNLEEQEEKRCTCQKKFCSLVNKSPHIFQLADNAHFGPVVFNHF